MAYKLFFFPENLGMAYVYITGVYKQVSKFTFCYNFYIIQCSFITENVKGGFCSGLFEVGKFTILFF